MKALFRVKSHEDFSLVIKQGKKVQNKEYSIYVLPTQNNYLRIGVATTNKLKTAVERNRQKRRLRALLDELCDYNKYSLDVVVVVKMSFVEKSYQENKESLKRLLEECI